MDAEAVLDRPGMACQKTNPNAHSGCEAQGTEQSPTGDCSAQTSGRISLGYFSLGETKEK